MQEVWLPPWLEQHRHRAWIGDVLLAAAQVVLVLKLQQPVITVVTVGLAVFAAVAVLVRRRAPERILAAATAVAVLTMITDTVAAGLFITLGVLTFTAAAYSPRRRPWRHAVLVWGVIVVTGSVMDFANWWGPDQFGLFAWIFGGAGAGDSARMRRAYISEVTERARQAEQTREEEARRRVMDERLRIARELHDVVAHHIAVISVHAGAAGHALRDRPDEVWPVLEHIRGAADTVLDEIKSVISVLRDPDETDPTEPAPGLDRLGDLLDGLHTMGFRVRRQEHGDPRPLPAMVDLAAYRIVQEALTNAHRYGDGSALLDLTYRAGELEIQVTNRMVWPRPGRAGSGFGLLGMRERAAAAQGEVTAGPIPGGGFRVRAVLPCLQGSLT
ncbi:histidine kinase [Actinoplanes sichuanensis]|uniref:histidine kinase n=1 Tax=Actinoplanes sichuanensis TaxID=512349 RepID=A0ABW4A6U8_9ACTN|nr:histidine kinase [Actinoplanes sichuanensis]BEL02863.1 histidine kinase [Actinoplanes sichuanensis]